MWIEILRTLELDKKAQSDLFLLAQQGIAGRSEANEILWARSSDHALKPSGLATRVNTSTGLANIIGPGIHQLLGPGAATTALETLISFLLLSLEPTISSQDLEEAR